MKTCKEIKVESEMAFDALFTQYREDIVNARQNEFPIGADVQWEHGANTARGQVIGYPVGGVGSYEEVVVENRSTGARRIIKAYLLEKDDDRK